MMAASGVMDDEELFDELPIPRPGAIYGELFAHYAAHALTKLDRIEDSSRYVRLLRRRNTAKWQAASHRERSSMFVT